ncbi:MAG: ATP-binding protein [Bacteroidaceae bacterium]|nr:ATP-binding protein [Bacteroidaceae bacterium]
METFYRTHKYLVEHVNAPLRRYLSDEIDWTARLIGIKGTRGVGKTTFLLQYAKENYGPANRHCLYINLNNFYFQGHTLVDFAGKYVEDGGQVLLIDQVFKMPNWSRQLRECYDKYPSLQIVFTGSSVMRLKEENPEIGGIVNSYNLRGLSFREYLMAITGQKLPTFTFEEILKNHESITRQISTIVTPSIHFFNYLHHGFYPFFLEKRNYSENLLKTMSMMIEVDILVIKQIELKYLTRIKKLFYELALDTSKAPNISKLAEDIETSRATVMNYVKNLADARLINMLHSPDEVFPKKPSRVLLHNSNLLYAIYPINAEVQEIMETFAVNCLWKDHKISQPAHEKFFLINKERKFRVIDAKRQNKVRMDKSTLYFRYNTDIGASNMIPIWILGFLY